MDTTTVTDPGLLLIKDIIDIVMVFFKHEFVVCGFTISYWQVALWSTIAGILIWFLAKLAD